MHHAETANIKERTCRLVSYKCCFEGASSSLLGWHIIGDGMQPHCLHAIVVALAL